MGKRKWKMWLLILLLAWSSAAMGRMEVYASETEMTESEEPEAMASGTCGESLTWTLDTEGKLVVSGSGEMEDVYEWHIHSAKTWGRYRKKIRSVVISEGVTGTGMNAFAECTELSSVELPASLRKIGDSSFYNCRKLTSIALPSGVAEIESYAFEACISLRSIVLPSGVSRIQGSTFYGCSNLERVEIEGELTEIEGFAFYECSSLREVEMPEGMTEINTYTFYGCSSLKSILIPEQIKRIEGFAFAGCSGLTELALPSGVTEIGEYAFADCSGLAELALPSGVTKIGEYAFAGCSGLTELTVPSGITEIKDYTFAWCTGLTRLNVPDTFIAYGKNVFCGCNDALGVYRSGHSEAITPGGLSDLAGAESSNKGTQNYNTYGRVVTSYLEENGDGTMNRVEYVGKRHDDGLAAGRHNKIGNYVTAERCSRDGRVLDRKKIPVELPLFGGFYAGEDYNFLVFGQPNPDEDDSVEVMRVVKVHEGLAEAGFGGLVWGEYDGAV